jgi:hypothetical protein
MTALGEFQSFQTFQSFKMFETTTHHEGTKDTKLGKFEFRNSNWRKFYSVDSASLR